MLNRPRPTQGCRVKRRRRRRMMMIIIIIIIIMQKADLAACRFLLHVWFLHIIDFKIKITR